jgi:hypothetical protein
MITFNGIINDNGKENTVRIYLDFDSELPYTTDFYLGDTRLDAKIEKNVCYIKNTEYEYVIKKYQNEIIFAAKEINGFFHCLFPCFCKQKFFVLSNKEEV